MLILAYVFWHWPAPDVDAAQYEAAVARFHEALERAAPGGFLRSTVARVDPLPFGPAGRAGYEDWYLLESSAALDLLDAAAISTACADAHGAAAALSAGGTAALYRLVAGSADVAGAPAASWLDGPGPAGRGRMVHDVSTRVTRAGGGLWMRRMTLGPAPELCLLAGPGVLGGEQAGAGIAQARSTVWGEGPAGPGTGPVG